MRRLIRASSIAVLVGFAACSQPPPQILGEPDFTLDPSGHAPLSGIVRFSTDRPSRVTLTVGDGENSLSATPKDEFSTEHELMVLGLRPGRTNTVEIEVESEDGTAGEAQSFTVETAPLPDYLPPIEVRVSRPAAMEPGLTLVPLFRWYEQQTDNDYGAILAIDAQGDVVWFYETDIVADEPRLMPNGNLFYQYNQPGGLVEIDMLGNEVRRWYAAKLQDDPPPNAIPVDIETFHHDTTLMPSGNFLTFSSEVRRFEDYPTSETDPTAPRAPTDVVGDVLVELTPAGEIVRDWHIFDLLDPYRMGYGSLGNGYWVGMYEQYYDPSPADWIHGNGLHYVAETDDLIVSSNHLSTIYKLDLASGEIEWMLGDPTGWREPWSDLLLEPEGDLTWSYQHHAPEITPQGTLLLYDNGGRRAIPPNPPIERGEESYSRAVEYAIDEASGTVRQVWSFGGPDEDDEWFMSPFISEADWMNETGNVLVTSGGRVTRVDGSVGMEPFEGHLWITIHEVTHTDPAEIVWEVVIDDPAVSWTAYRTERIAGLYR